MPHPIAQRLASLPQLSKASLYDLWKQLFNASPSPKLRRDLMIPILASRLQEQAFGSLGARTRDRLRNLSRAFERDSDLAIPSAPQIRAGTRLVRQWRDQRHLKKLRWKRRRKPISSAGRLVPVELAARKSPKQHEPSCGLAVVLSGGRRIEVHPDFDTNTFERLVSALERA